MQFIPGVWYFNQNIMNSILFKEIYFGPNIFYLYLAANSFLLNPQIEIRKAYQFFPTWRSQPDAAAHCQSLGGKLANITTDCQLDEIRWVKDNGERERQTRGIDRKQDKVRQGLCYCSLQVSGGKLENLKVPTAISHELQGIFSVKKSDLNIYTSREAIVGTAVENYPHLTEMWVDGTSASPPHALIPSLDADRPGKCAPLKKSNI